MRLDAAILFKNWREEYEWSGLLPLVKYESLIDGREGITSWANHCIYKKEIEGRSNEVGDRTILIRTHIQPTSKVLYKEYCNGIWNPWGIAHKPYRNFPWPYRRALPINRWLQNVTKRIKSSIVASLCTYLVHIGAVVNVRSTNQFLESALPPY